MSTHTVSSATPSGFRRSLGLCQRHLAGEGSDAGLGQGQFQPGLLADQPAPEAHSRSTVGIRYAPGRGLLVGSRPKVMHPRHSSETISPCSQHVRTPYAAPLGTLPPKGRTLTYEVHQASLAHARHEFGRMGAFDFWRVESCKVWMRVGCAILASRASLRQPFWPAGLWARSSSRFSARGVGSVLIIRVRDDGRGFDTGKPPPGLGLEYMRRRTGEVGADLDVISTPGRGTSVQVRFRKRRDTANP